MRRANLAPIVAVVAAIAIPSTLWAQFPTPVYIFPVVVKAKGVGTTDWRSKLSISNIGEDTANLTAFFFKENQTNTFPGTSLRASSHGLRAKAQATPALVKTGVSVGAGKTLVVDDVIAAWFPAAGVKAKGWLLITETSEPVCPPPEDELLPMKKLVVNQTIYNAGDPTKIYDQTVEASWFAMNFTQGYPSVITGIAHQGPDANPGARTNVGVANISSQQISVLIKLFKPDGTLAGQSTQSIQALSMRQWSLDDLNIPRLPNGGGRLEISLASTPLDICALLNGDIPLPVCTDPCDPSCTAQYSEITFPIFIPYASNVQNGTGDGSNLLPMMDLVGFATWALQYVMDNCSDASPLAQELIQRIESRRASGPTFRRIR